MEVTQGTRFSQKCHANNQHPSSIRLEKPKAICPLSREKDGEKSEYEKGLHSYIERKETTPSK